MAEELAHYGGKINLPAFEQLYKAWAEGGWAIVITGALRCDPFLSPDCPYAKESTAYFAI